MSILLHLGLVAAAVTVMPKMVLVVEQAPFKWDVALVERVHDTPSPEAPAPTLKVQPSKPLPTQTIRPVEPPPEAVMPRVALQQSPAIVHPVVEPPKPQPTVQPPQEIVQVQPEPVERRDIKKEEIKEPEPTVQEMTQDMTATAQPYDTSITAATQPAVERHAEPAGATSAPSVAVAEPASVSPSDAPAAFRIEPGLAQPAPVTHEQSPATAGAPALRPAVKADYAWLAESLGRRVAALTRYPSSARLNGWEGRVVLRAVIRADGHLMDVTVHKSSGHDALDRAALETIKLACPLHMKHALNSTEVAVYVPIVYSLSG